MTVDIGPGPAFVIEHDKVSLSNVLRWNRNRHWGAETVAPLASLVRVASDFHHRPSRTSAASLAPKRRKEMDGRHHQRFGTTMDLSESEGSRRAALDLAATKACAPTPAASPRWPRSA